MDFSGFGLRPEILKAVEEAGYRTPTPIQEKAIPIILTGVDLLGIAQTGTGKTAAFVLPMIEKLAQGQAKARMPRSLIISPTRELAMQTANYFETYGKHVKLSMALLIGGVSLDDQARKLERGVDVLIATPGRLLDILKRGKLDLSHLQILCLDEADEMLSMGFAEELDAIMEFVPDERQSLLFSATVTEDVKALAGTMLYYPEFLTFSEDSVAAEDVEHHYFTVRGVGRARNLLKVLDYEEPETAIIFANTKDDTFMVTRFLKRHGKRAEVLNGDLPQKQREKTLGALRASRVSKVPSPFPVASSDTSTR